MSYVVRIDGLENSSPNLRKFVEKTADEVVRAKPDYNKDGLEVMFYREETRLLPNYEEDEGLNFFTFDGNDLDDSIDEDFPHVQVFLRVSTGLGEESRLWIGQYNVVEDNGEKESE